MSGLRRCFVSACVIWNVKSSGASQLLSQASLSFYFAHGAIFSRRCCLSSVCSCLNRAGCGEEFLLQCTHVLDKRLAAGCLKGCVCIECALGS